MIRGFRSRAFRASILARLVIPVFPHFLRTSARLREVTSNLIKMTDYHDKGFAVVDLMDPRFAAGLWRDIDQDAIRKLLEKAHEKHWQPLSFPRTPSFLNFNQELENVGYYFLSEF